MPSVSLTSLKVTRSTNTSATPSSLGRGPPGSPSRAAPGASCGSGSPVTGSCSAWYAFSWASCCSVATSRPLARATLAWLASVSNSRRSSSTNELTSVSRLATTIAPTVTPSVVSGTIAASFTPTSPSHPGSGSPGSNSRASLSGSSSARSAASSAGEMLAAIDVVAPRQQARCGHAGPNRREQQGTVLAAQDLASAEHHGPLELLEVRAAERPGEVVQRLQVLVALREAHVGAVEQEQHDASTPTTSQPEVGLVPEGSDEDDPERGVRERPRAPRR